MSSSPYCVLCGGMASPTHTCPPKVDPSGEMPPDPIGQMAEDATTLHEMFTSYVAAGFSDDQAMRIVLQTHQTLLQMKIGLMLSQGYNPFESGR